MSSRSVQCPHCGRLHELGVSVCPFSNRPIVTSTRRAPTAPRSVAGLVVPRPPSPLGISPRLRVRATSRRALIGSTIEGKYMIRRVIGEGGMGTVFEAEQLNIRRLVAIKVLHPAQARKAVAVKRFYQEARAVGSIGHPNICDVYDMGSLEDGSPYLVLERLTGQTLSTRIGAEGRVPAAEAVDIFLQVSSALIAAHDRGILHRDIKPENVFLSQRPGCPAIVKLLDFGVSKILPSAGGDFEEETLTKTGMVMGTPYYMAPEQARGQRDLDGRLDIYGCGVVMYEILAGQRPFNGANYNALLLAILTGKATPLRELDPTISPALEQLVMRSMANSRADRFMNATEFRAAINEVSLRLSQDAEPGPIGLGAKERSPSLVSVEIPISFDEPVSEREHEVQNEPESGPEPEVEEEPTLARRPSELAMVAIPSSKPLMQSGDEYEDSGNEHTLLMSRESTVPKLHARDADADTNPEVESPVRDDETLRIDSREVEFVVQALRDAERSRRGK